MRRSLAGSEVKKKKKLNFFLLWRSNFFPRFFPLSFSRLFYFPFHFPCILSLFPAAQ